MSKIEGNHRERRERRAGRQAQIVATLISRKDQIAGITLSPKIESAYCKSRHEFSTAEGRLACLIETTSKIHNILETNDASYASTRWGLVSTHCTSASGQTYMLPRPNINNTLNFFLLLIRNITHSGIGRIMIITSRAIPIPLDAYASMLRLTHWDGMVLFHTPAGALFSLRRYEGRYE